MLKNAFIKSCPNYMPLLKVYFQNKKKYNNNFLNSKSYNETKKINAVLSLFLLLPLIHMGTISKYLSSINLNSDHELDITVTLKKLFTKLPKNNFKGFLINGSQTTGQHA